MAVKGADVRVIGVGGAGGNAVRRLAEQGAGDVVLIAANTDCQALARTPADVRVVLGRRATRGLGAGGIATVGHAAAREATSSITRAVHGADLVFVALGLGGGTGTGAAPIVASAARDAGALVVAVATLPFSFEGTRRARLAREGLETLREQVDSLLVIPNDHLLSLAGAEPTAIEAFALADDVLSDGVRGIGDLVVRPGLVNLDFADVRAVLANGGRAVMGMGFGRGRDRAAHAVEDAMESPLLAEASIAGARGVLLSFTIDPQLSLARIHEAATRVNAAADDDAEILFGVSVDPTLHDEVRVTLVAAGMPEEVGAPALVPARRRNALVMLS